jgi:hypothetical protein
MKQCQFSAGSVSVRGKQPIHQYDNGAGEQYGADRGHGGADPLDLVR